MDHKVLIEQDEGCVYFAGEKGNANRLLVIQDQRAQWIQAYQVPTSDHQRLAANTGV